VPTVPDSSIPGVPPDDRPFRDRIGGQPAIRLGGRLPSDLIREERDALAERGQFLREQLDLRTAERDRLSDRVAELTSQLRAVTDLVRDTPTILPPPRAVVSAAYLVSGVDGPKLILEVCPRCTSGDDSRMCFCRVQCTYAACGWDDPLTLLVPGVGDEPARTAPTELTPPEALAAEWADFAKRAEAGAREWKPGVTGLPEYELGRATGYGECAVLLSAKLAPAWAAMAAQLAELQREREQAIAGGWTADATRRVAEISADNAMLRGKAEDLARVREVVGAYENEELNPITAFGEVVRILRPDLDGGRHD
jgi:hypothetical protein